MPGGNVISIAIDAQDNKWFGIACPYIAGSGGCVAKYDDLQWIVYDVTSSPLPDNPITSIVIDANGNKWFSSFGSGVFIFNENGIITGVQNEITSYPAELVLYPNPAQDHITIEISSSENIQSAKLSNMHGRLVKKQDFGSGSKTMMDVYDVPNGLYLVKIISDKNIYSNKVIID